MIGDAEVNMKSSRLCESLTPSHEVLEWYLSLEEWNITLPGQKSSVGPSYRWLSAEQLEDFRLTEKILYELRVLLGFYSGYLDLGGRHPLRYETVLKLWERFHKDLRLVRQHSSPTSTSILNPHGKILVVEQPATDPPELLSAFEATWKLQRCDWPIVEALHDEVHAIITENRDPLLQRRRLLSLPPELLHIIISYVSVPEASRFGATCYMLRQISIPHIYRSRNISLKFRIDENKALSLDPVESQQLIRQEAELARAEFVEHLFFLLSSPTVGRTMETLNIRCWSLHQITRIKWEEAESMVTFLNPVLGGVHTIIQHCPHLKQLSISNAFMLEAHMTAIVSLPQLHHLSIIACKTLSDIPLPTVHSNLQHLTLVLQEDMDMPSWRLLSVFPALRWLEICRDEDFLDTPDGAWEAANPFTTLERVSIVGLHLQEIDEIMTLINSAAQSSGLKLTHFKVKAAYGLPDDMLLDLLGVLSTAPLEHLIIDGIQDAGCDVLDRIAQLFPRLRTLALSYRDSTRQYRDGFARWPRCTWEYAAHLSRLVHLEHFGWNLHVPHETHLPRALRSFEDGFPADSYDDDVDASLRASAEKVNIVKLFGSHCPSLQSLAFFAGRIPAYHYWIDRDSNGSSSIRPESKLSSQLHHIESWPMFS